MNTKDFKLVTIIGGLVGLLSQPVLANTIVQVQGILPAPLWVLRLGFFVFFLLLAPFALWIAYLLSRFVKVIYQFAKFAAVGSLNSFVDLGVFNIATLLLGYIPQTGLFAIFKAFSFLAATTNSYIWNRHWTFEAKDRTNTTEALKFYSIAILSGILNVLIATLVRKINPAAVPEEVWVNVIAPISGILSSFIFNFLGYKFWVFKKA